MSARGAAAMAAGAAGARGVPAAPDPKIECLTIHPYRLPLTRPWGSARGRLGERLGWLVRVEAGGLSGHGDCPPLPEAGTETHDCAAAALARGCRRLAGLTLGEALGALRPAAAPAAAFALECALLDLRGRLLGVPLRRLLDPGAADRVPVNAALGPLDRIGEEDLAAAWAAGFRVLKLKVGIGAADLELARLRALAGQLPAGASLRLDANGAWDLPTATRLIGALAELPIESLEEPLADPDPEALARLQSRAPFPLALDESLQRVLATFPAWGSPGPGALPVRRAVLKPAVIGGLRPSLALARRLRAAGVEPVVTGVLECAAGLWATAQLAAALGDPIPQGLATAHWLAADLGPAPHPQRGHIELPVSPGSGFLPADHWTCP
jgi:o-succinylbenzoate synthase